MVKFKVARQMKLDVVNVCGGRPKNRRTPRCWPTKGQLRCVWCNIPVKKSGYGPTMATREHLIPRSLGGGNGPNIAVACARCNHTRKSSMEWIRWRNVEHYGGFKPALGTAYGWDGKGGIIELLRPLVML